jgi:hypothetical protein
LTLSACDDKTVRVNIPSTYSGYVYIISAKGELTQRDIEIDKNGIIYISEYCSDEVTLVFTINNIKMNPERSYVSRHFATSNHEGLNYSVTYSTFHFPFRPTRDYVNEPENIHKLIEQGKVDINRLKSCE